MKINEFFESRISMAIHCETNEQYMKIIKEEIKYLNSKRMIYSETDMRQYISTREDQWQNNKDKTLRTNNQCFANIFRYDNKVIKFKDIIFEEIKEMDEIIEF